MSKETNDIPQDENGQEEKPPHKWGALTRWGHGQAQPSSESKRAGWLKKKRNRDLIQIILGMKYVGTGGKFAQQMKEYFGLTPEQVEELSNEAAMVFRMVGQAIEKGDTASANLILERGYGKPKEVIDLTDEEGNKPIINITVVNSISGENPPPIKESENEDIQTGDNNIIP